MVFWTDENQTDEPRNDEIPDGDRSDGSETGEPLEGGTRSEDGVVSVGVCSECGASLPRPNVVIEYETGDEWEQVALCPECQTLAVA